MTSAPPNERFVRFELAPRPKKLHAEVVVLDRAAALAAEPEILRENSIPAPSRLH